MRKYHIQKGFGIKRPSVCALGGCNKPKEFNRVCYDHAVHLNFPEAPAGRPIF